MCSSQPRSIRRRRSGVRVAAFQAIQHHPAGRAIASRPRFRSDPDAGLKAAALDAPRDKAATDAIWQDALEGRLPDEPGAASRGCADRARSTAPLGALQKMIDAVASDRRIAAGRTPSAINGVPRRGALHQALALRGSRVAVYDLRETIEEAREPLPVSFLAALHVVGDESCVESLAAAYARTPSEEARWRHQLGAAFRAIASREKITRRHAGHSSASRRDGPMRRESSAA